VPHSADAAALIVAGGTGRRFGDGLPKQYRALAGVPILLRSIEPFLDHSGIGGVWVVVPPADAVDPPGWLAGLPITLVAGGAERADSVRHGIEAIPTSFRRVLVHDGARPLLRRPLIDRLLEVEGVAVIPGLPLTDTVKQVSRDRFVERTIPRDHLWRVQTPQAFPLRELREVHERARVEGLAPTDDAALFERFGLPVRIVEGDPVNLKVTEPVDLAIAEALAYRLLGGSR
jgi:2-C-methyl-D-erythritol 4-phosphate cytidylyltransferase